MVEYDPINSPLESIAITVCNASGWRLATLHTWTRQSQIVWHRQVAMYLQKELTPFGYETIAKYWGGCHHCTILHAYRVVRDRMAVHPEIRQQISHLLTRARKEMPLFPAPFLQPHHEAKPQAKVA